MVVTSAFTSEWYNFTSYKLYSLSVTFKHGDKGGEREREDFNCSYNQRKDGNV